MLLNFLWFGLILLSVLADLCSGQPFSSSQAALAGAAAGIELTLSLAGPICLWSALARAMEQTGLTVRLCRALRPGLRRLFPACARRSGCRRCPARPVRRTRCVCWS